MNDMISSQARYDRFDNSPYFLSQHQPQTHLRNWGELMGRTRRYLLLNDSRKPPEYQGFLAVRFRIGPPISSQPRYDHFDTTP